MEAKKTNLFQINETFQITQTASNGDKLGFVAITVGSQYQQENITPDYFWLHMRSFWGRTSNLLAWKIHPPTSPYYQRNASIARSSGSY